MAQKDVLGLHIKQVLIALETLRLLVRGTRLKQDHIVLQEQRGLVQTTRMKELRAVMLHLLGVARPVHQSVILTSNGMARIGKQVEKAG